MCAVCVCVYLLFVALFGALDDCLLLVVPFAEVVACGSVERHVVAASHDDFRAVVLFDPELFAVDFDHLALNFGGFWSGGDKFGFGGDCDGLHYFIFAEFCG